MEEVRPSLRARRSSQSDQAFFLFHHLEEARDEIRYCCAAEREDPVKILAILKGALRVLRVLCCTTAGLLL